MAQQSKHNLFGLHGTEELLECPSVNCDRGTESQFYNSLALQPNAVL